MVVEGALGLFLGITGAVLQEERIKYTPLLLVNFFIAKILMWMGCYLYYKN